MAASGIPARMSPFTIGGTPLIFPTALMTRSSVTMPLNILPAHRSRLERSFDETGAMFFLSLEIGPDCPLPDQADEKGPKPLADLQGRDREGAVSGQPVSAAC